MAAGLLNLFLVVLIVAVVAVAAWWFFNVSSKEGFADYAPSDLDSKCKYDQATLGSRNRAVMYYAPWCPHCKDFKPEFEKASQLAAGQGLDVAFASVNSDTQAPGSDCLRFKGVTGFPTVLLEKGSASPPYLAYNGPRTAAAMVAWVKANL